jgi:hypothetical protein
MTSGVNTKSTNPRAIVPDGGWGWIIVFASFMIHFIMDGLVDFLYFFNENLVFQNNRITYSMGDVFLRPMMDRLNSTRGPVSVIFGILPAITLGTGEKVFIQEKTFIL